MKTISKQVRAVHYGNAVNPLVEVDYFKSEELFIIINEKNELIEIQQQNIQALIAMLQSINSGIKMSMNPKNQTTTKLRNQFASKET